MKPPETQNPIEIVFWLCLCTKCCSGLRPCMIGQTFQACMCAQTYARAVYGIHKYVHVYECMYVYVSMCVQRQRHTCTRVCVYVCIYYIQVHIYRQLEIYSFASSWKTSSVFTEKCHPTVDTITKIKKQKNKSQQLQRNLASICAAAPNLRCQPLSCAQAFGGRELCCQPYAASKP